ncbi:HNH endonuclease [Fimbriiglobus ruber]|uniref:Nuclear zinc finger protein Np95 n=1 Tax=Fimbriiglobus ruber TaxID=1908690 RepID=A0A225DGD3_9BACT|nr:HNH endonuclease signature motif containing protein [Fimbriiglobus ruber]OWK35455.1 Nuclear zinc finger protein Np95 [Fimbriiglobus ruber]
MRPELSSTGNVSGDLDQVFYRRVVQSRTHADLFECRKIASQSKDELLIRAFVAAMFTSKAHRKEVSSCIREYIGRRAIPALLWNLPRLSTQQRMFQARLLCTLGHWEALEVYYRAFQEMDQVDANARKSIVSFLTNYSPKLLPGMRRSLESNDGSYAIFCAPYLHKYHPLEVSIRLAAITRDPGESIENRGKALHLLIAFSPDSAARCLVECGGSFPISLLLSTLAQLAVSEDGKPFLPAVFDDFAQHHDDRRLAARLCSPRQDSEDREVQFRWITEQLTNWINEGAQAEMPRWVRHVAKQLCRADHPEWVSYLESAVTTGHLAKFARGVLIASQHPAGLRLLRKQIESASKPEELYLPCIEAIRAYREDATGVLETVVAAGNAKLRDRIEQIVSLTWPGKTIDQMLDLLKKSSAPVPTAPLESAEPAEPTAVRTLRRKARTTSSFERNRGIADEAKFLEQYCCQVCGRKLVNARTGEPYAESHHVHPLGHDGSDTIDNLLCLCPLCHAFFHLGCIGIDKSLGVHLSGAATQERFFQQLRVASGRRISPDALRHHWGVLFIPPEDRRFESDPDDDAAER